MSQFFTDDVDALIKSGHGDQGRLARIRAEYVAKKLVTLDDRKYVEGLMARYMRPEVEPQEAPKPKEERIVPPPPQPRPQDQFELKHQKAKQESIPKVGGAKKKGKMAIAAIAAVIAAVAAGAAIVSQDITFPGADENALEVDQESYALGDIISITGTASSANSVRLSIADPQGVEIWSETVKARAEGRYSTLVIAGGDGWSGGGTYTLSAAYGQTVDQATFEFSPVAQN